MVYFVGDHQWLRYKSCYEQCRRQRYADMELIESSVCQNPIMRHEYGQHKTVNCELAERRSRFSVQECARNMWRKNGEWMRIWKLLTESYLRLIGVILPIVLGFMYMFFRFLSKTRVRQARQDKEFKFLHRYLPPPRYEQNPFQITEGRRKKRARSRIRQYDERDWVA